MDKIIDDDAILYGCCEIAAFLRISLRWFHEIKRRTKTTIPCPILIYGHGRGSRHKRTGWSTKAMIIRWWWQVLASGAIKAKTNPRKVHHSGE
jgi:hypothetical protein